MVLWTSDDLIAYTTRRGLQDPKPQSPVRNEPLGAAQGAPQGSGRVVVRFVSYRRRLLDRTNLHGGCKYLEDALVYAGLIKDDSEAEVDTTVRQVKVKTKAEERTEIELQYPG